MSTDNYIMEREKAAALAEQKRCFDAGFAAALSEHEQVGWWHPRVGKITGLGTFGNAPESQILAEGWIPTVVRSVEVQSSEVPRTPEEPT